MRKLVVVLGLAGVLALAAPALAEVFVIGPGMLGHPADDPSVGYSSLVLDQAFVSPDAPFAPAGAEVPLRPWEETWYQMGQRPGV
jgi:hypothetical protein